jgi:hypothetical protein
MADKGLIDEFDVQVKTAELLSKTSSELDVFREAAKMRGNVGNVFFSSDTTASEYPSDDQKGQKRGMFEGVI